MTERFEILVVGAGPAGIAAAARAAEAGQSVALLDDNPAAGGQIWRNGAPVPAQAREWLARLESSRAVRLQGWRVIDCPEQHVVRAERSSYSASGGSAESFQDNCADFGYKKLILATGARERFLPFPGWTLPNVMGAGGLDAMVRGGLPIAGKRVVVAGTGPLLLAVAAHLAGHGAKILAVCEQAPLTRLARFAAGMVSEPAKLWQGAGYSLALWPARLKTSCWPVAAHGDDRLRGLTLRQGERQWDVDCDYLACGFHLVPNTELPALLGCRMTEGFVTTDEWMRTSCADVYCAGEPTGIGGVDVALLEGQIAGLAAAGREAQARQFVEKRRARLGFVRALREACELDPQLRTLAVEETIVCRCEDVRCGALRTRASWREAKLHTRCGMGPCQGRICGAAAEFLFGWKADSVRPPIFPALVSSLAALPGGIGGAESPLPTAGIISDNSKETA
jgi:NADPH-dependent 2,4-dienoyl-CoA reductase/sulfur reductase-like enzyme